jgi:hypothetical protein
MTSVVTNALTTGARHEIRVTGLAENTTYGFAAKAVDTQVPSLPQTLPSDVIGDGYSPMSAIVFATTATCAVPVGGGQFVDLSENLPIDPATNSPMMTQVGNGIRILKNVNGAQKPWMVFPDEVRGVQIFKVADASNIAACRSIDERPAGAPDGMPDILDRDRNLNRYGWPSGVTGSLGACDGVVDDLFNPADPIDWGFAGTYAMCNLPLIKYYSQPSDVEVGRINADALPDLVVASSSFDGTPDAVFINTGSDLCDVSGTDWPHNTYARTADSADGVPCFSRPANVTPQSGTKQPTGRVRLFSLQADQPANFLVVMGGGDGLNHVTFFKNLCRTKLGACSYPSGDVYDANSIAAAAARAAASPDFIQSASPMFYDASGNVMDGTVDCEDAAFLDLNADGLKDMVCVRANRGFCDPANPAGCTGKNWIFTSSEDLSSDAGYRLTQANSWIPALTNEALDCNASFAETNRMNGVDVLAVGHTRWNVSSEGTPNSCTNKIFRRDNGGTWQVTSIANPTGKPALSCQNAALDDVGFRSATRTGAAVDVALACGLANDMNSYETGGVGTYRGTHLFLDNGTGTFVDFEVSEPALFNAVTGTMTRGSALVFDGDINGSTGGLKPGAVNAVGIGDLDLDGVPDLYFGNGMPSLYGPHGDMFFKQLLGTGSLAPANSFYRATPSREIPSSGGSSGGGGGGPRPYHLPD